MDEQNTPYLGIGIVRADSRDAMIEAAQLTAQIVRSLVSDNQAVKDALPHLAQAQRHPIALSNGDTLHLFILAWPGTAPSGYRAVFAASTRRWKRGAEPLTKALDAFVADFVHQQGWDGSPIVQTNTTAPGLHFFAMRLVKLQDNDF
jgi:hypothetical protein